MKVQLMCPLCDEMSNLTLMSDEDGYPVCFCGECGKIATQQEVDAANRDDIPVLRPIPIRANLPTIPEFSRPTRIDVYAGCRHPQDDDWLRDTIDSTFAFAERITIDTWSYPEEAA